MEADRGLPARASGPASTTSAASCANRAPPESTYRLALTVGIFLVDLASLVLACKKHSLSFLKAGDGHFYFRFTLGENCY